jgi:hypothetical protein
MRFKKLLVATLAVCSAICMAPQSLNAQQTMNNDAIIKLAKAGLSDDLIISTINIQPGTYDTSTDGLIALKKAGVPDKVVGAILTKSFASTPAAAQQPPSVKSESPSPSAMTNNNVIQLVTSGLSEQEITKSIRQAPTTRFDLTTMGYLNLKKAGVSDALILVMRTADPSATPAIQPYDSSERPSSPVAKPAPAPDNGCSDVEFMGLGQISATSFGGAWIYVATIRNKANYTKEVDIEYVKNGVSTKGTFNVGAGQKIDAQLDLNNHPPTNVHMTACR